ncbi:Cytochrome c oxidase assembly protein cox11, mitochondrial [Microsporum audouinii]
MERLISLCARPAVGIRAATAIRRTAGNSGCRIPTRGFASQIPPRQQSAPTATRSLRWDTKNTSTMPFQICQQTGWNGQPVSTHLTNTDTSSRVIPVTDSRRLRITFNASVSDVLPWKFTPQQREVRVLPGETALAFYTASNKGDQDIIGVATYSVTPAQVSPYFSKIQCFCFEEQRLNAGETVDMPVFFFIDPDFAKDPAMKGIDTITLSYTFFKARYDKDGVLRPTP